MTYFTFSEKAATIHQIDGKIRDASGRFFTKIKYFSKKFKAVESLKFNPFDSKYKKPVKCQTFFSHLLLNARQIDISLDIITLNFELSYDWFPMNELGNLYFSLHSPNTIPEMTLENYIILKPKIQYRFAYSQIKTELLDSRYDTNCFE